jgi:hypothetical protein
MFAARRVAQGMRTHSAAVDQAEVSLVDEGCGLQGMAAALTAHMPVR